MEIFAFSARYIYRTFTSKGTFIILSNIVQCSPLVALQWYRNRWPWRSFQPRLSFPRPFQQSLAGFRVARAPSNNWASCLLLWCWTYASNFMKIGIRTGVTNELTWSHYSVGGRPGGGNKNTHERRSNHVGTAAQSTSVTERQTDKFTMTKIALSIASRGKNAEKWNCLCNVSVNCITLSNLKT